MYIKVAPQSSWQGVNTPPIYLDNLDIEDPMSWLNLGYPPSMEGVGDLSSPGAAFRLLSMFGA